MDLYAPIATSALADAELDDALAIDGGEITVVDETKLPDVGYVSVMRLGDEVIVVTGAATGPYSVVRAVDGTTAALHVSGTELRHVIAPEAIRTLRDSVNPALRDVANTFTERNDFTDKLTNIERPAIPTNEEYEQYTGVYVTVKYDASPTDPYISFDVLDAPTDDPGAGTPYVIFNPDNGEYVEARPYVVLLDRVTYQVDRAKFNSPAGEWTAGTLAEVMQAGPLAIQLTFDGKARKRVKTNGKVIEFKLPNPLEDGHYGDEPTKGDGALITLGDNAGQVTSGGIRVSDPLGNITDMTSTGGRIESVLDYNTANDEYGWTTMASQNEIDPGLGLQRLVVRAATAGVLPNSGVYGEGVISAQTPGVLTVDGVTLDPGDLLLVKDQTNGAHNLLYEVEVSEAGVVYQIRRVPWLDENAEILAGVPIYVSEGSVNKGTAWVLATPAPFVVGTTSLALKQLNTRDIRFDFYADAGTPNTQVETDLYSASLPAGLLKANGDKVSMFVAVDHANNGNSKRDRYRFNNTVVLDTGAVAYVGAAAYQLELVRESATVARYTSIAYLNGVAPIVTTGRITGLTFTSSRILKLTSQNGANSANDTVAKHGYVEFARAA